MPPLPAYIPQTQRGWLAVLLAAVLISVGGMALQRGGASALPTTAAPRVGFLAPDFTLPTHTGDELTLSDLRGRAIVLNFWATWCAPCRVETPYFQALSQQYVDEVVFVGVNQGETAVTIQMFADNYELTYPLVLDENSQINREYAVFGLPTTYFIDADGVIRHVTPGAINQAVLEDQIKALLAP
ncbi:MAG: TlpA family protein disulfide reductase [Chloroflexi bacterium]|nr:TlpA family protein disulfide reductase [Chloroflexota bacterium]